MNFDDIAQLIHKRFGIWLGGPQHRGTHGIGMMQRIIKERWDEFTDEDKELIRSIFVIDDSVRPVLISF